MLNDGLEFFPLSMGGKGIIMIWEPGSVYILYFMFYVLFMFFCFLGNVCVCVCVCVYIAPTRLRLRFYAWVFSG